MSTQFNSRSGLILVRAELSGPTGVVLAKLALDTGANSTILRSQTLGLAGYRPENSTDLARLTAGTGTAMAPRLMLNRLTALGHHAIGLRVLAHDLPPEAGIDGLLGLDFFRDRVLTIDFRDGRIDMA